MQNEKQRDNTERSGAANRWDLRPIVPCLVKGGLVSAGATTGGVAGCVGGGGTGAAFGFCLGGPPGAAVGYLCGLGSGALIGALGGGLATQKVVSKLGI